MQEIKDATIVNSQSIHEIKDATMANTKAIARLEGQLGHLVAKLNRIEEEEFQSQEMERGQYMIDEDASSNSYHEHVQATTTPGNEETVKEIFCEPSLEDPSREHFDQFGGDLDLGKLLEKAKIFNEPSLEDPLKECFAHYEFDLDLDMIREQAQPLLDPTLGMRTEKGKLLRHHSSTHFHQQLSLSLLRTRWNKMRKLSPGQIFPMTRK